jgi:FKBP-type peptidyl-prolyl cis-trans isomerase
MAKPKGQRIGIMIILVIMVFGTIGSFAVMILANENQTNQQVSQQAAITQYTESIEAQTKELSDKYYPVLSKYADRPSSFDRDGVDELVVKDLQEGDGETIDEGTPYAAYYIGWNPDGKIFDQSLDGESLKEPIDPNMGLIEGWGEGVKGMKLGGVREITIPSDKAYGEAGAGDDIPPNTPIKFIVLAIAPPDDIPIPDELMAGGL